ncbi:hypothetical protein SELMODRAFT_416838 [Selaginella moellendorffii]|uniref:Uncharacterized protein n=1 Tax=Selaginella moellendorffii TaxID=88036 RepID=D8S0K1_SELML|nr:hypothetical protein SELMODRAFT_416838 [Selaginella moellendorffii]
MVDPADDVFQLVVGNPGTQEWSELPPLHWEDRERYSLAGVIDFAMFVNKNGFKVGLHYTAVDFSGHWCCIYDSAMRSWSSSRLDDYFYDPTILGFYDFGRARWSTGEVVRSLRITTGLEDKVDPDGEILRCVLPLLGLCTARLSTMASDTWQVAGCMWEATARQGSPELMAMACGRLTVRVAWLPSLQRPIKRCLMKCTLGSALLEMVFRCSVHAEAYLVIFSETGLMFVYDLSTGDWGEVGGHVDEYSKAVIFRPSLRTPR